MKELKGIVWVLAVAIVAVAIACGGETPDETRGHGVVKSIDVGARKVTLDHEDIPGLMMAMTMTFDVAPGVALGELQPGIEVDFWVKEEGGVYTVTEIRRSDL